VQKTQRDKRCRAIKECCWLAWQRKHFCKQSGGKVSGRKEAVGRVYIAVQDQEAGFSCHSAITLEGRFTAGVEDGEGK